MSKHAIIEIPVTFRVSYDTPKNLKAFLSHVHGDFAYSGITSKEGNYDATLTKVHVRRATRNGKLIK